MKSPKEKALEKKEYDKFISFRKKRISTKYVKGQEYVPDEEMARRRKEFFGI